MFNNGAVTGKTINITDPYLRPRLYRSGRVLLFYRMNHGDENMSRQLISIYNDQELILSRVKVDGNYWQRLCGLMFYRDFPGIDGLLLFPCNFVHMLGMRFPLDIIYLNRNKEILYTVDVLVPFKIGPLVADAYYVLEMPAGVVAAKKIKLGTVLNW